MARKIKLRNSLGILAVALIILPLSLTFFQREHPDAPARHDNAVVLHVANPANVAEPLNIADSKADHPANILRPAKVVANLAKGVVAANGANLKADNLPNAEEDVATPANVADSGAKQGNPRVANFADQGNAAHPAKVKVANSDKENVPARIAANLAKPAVNRAEPARDAPVRPNRNVDIFARKIDFENFDNQTGAYYYIVPNTIHFIRFNTTDFTFSEFICVLAAFKNQRPDHIMFHTNVEEFEGKYWEMIQSIDELNSIISIHQTELPSTVFGQKLSDDWREWHASDITRIKTIMNYGGIYLDNDVYVVQSLDRYRVFELALGWDEKELLGTQVIIGHKDARFLPMWLNSYRQYRPDLWYYNAGEKPTREILEKRPELVHRVKLKFGIHNLLAQMFTHYWKEWRDQHTIHLLVGHRYYLDPHYKKIKDFDEYMIQDYKFTFGEMARDILDHFGF